MLPEPGHCSAWARISGRSLGRGLRHQHCRASPSLSPSNAPPQIQEGFLRCHPVTMLPQVSAGHHHLVDCSTRKLPEPQPRSRRLQVCLLFLALLAPGALAVAAAAECTAEAACASQACSTAYAASAAGFPYSLDYTTTGDATSTTFIWKVSEAAAYADGPGLACVRCALRGPAPSAAPLQAPHGSTPLASPLAGLLPALRNVRPCLQTAAGTPAAAGRRRAC